MNTNFLGAVQKNIYWTVSSVYEKHFISVSNENNKIGNFTDMKNSHLRENHITPIIINDE